MGMVAFESNASFRQCQFISMTGVEDASLTYGISIDARAQVVMNECLVSGFPAAIDITDSHTRTVLKRCQVLECLTATFCQMNSSVLVADCALAADYVLMLYLNERGKVQFERNSVNARGNRWPQDAVIRTDREPEVVEHEFKKVRISYFEPPEYYEPCIGATRKSREKYTEFESKMAKLWRHQLWSHQEKFCLYCDKNQSEKPEVKFQYCIRCRKVCYCSKECQNAHWRDHKMVCKKD